MKRIRIILAAIFCCMISATVFAGQPISPQKLPASIKNFVQTHFKGHTITHAECEYESGRTKYDVYLDDGTKIDFDSDSWDTMNGKRHVVPTTAVPSTAGHRVKVENHGFRIGKIDIDDDDDEIELFDDLEVKFTPFGVVLDIDD